MTVTGQVPRPPLGRSQWPLTEERYDKIHLFDAFGTRESEHVAPGSRLVTVDVLGTTIGVATCYDLRFAAQFTALGRAGARVVCVCRRRVKADPYATDES